MFWCIITVLGWFASYAPFSQINVFICEMRASGVPGRDFYEFLKLFVKIMKEWDKNGVSWADSSNKIQEIKLKTFNLFQEFNWLNLAKHIITVS